MNDSAAGNALAPDSERRRSRMKYIYSWSGGYVAFVLHDWLFDTKGKYLGWVEPDRTVWDRGGRFLGEVVDFEYVMRNTMRVAPSPKTPRLPPSSPVPLVRPFTRAGRVQREGWVDVFDEDWL